MADGYPLFSLFTTKRNRSLVKWKCDQPLPKGDGFFCTFNIPWINFACQWTWKTTFPQITSFAWSTLPLIVSTTPSSTRLIQEADETATILKCSPKSLFTPTHSASTLLDKSPKLSAKTSCSCGSRAGKD